ncbi:MAG: hypothetical protein QOH04_2829 [Sphingomonadales bacterium]|jgi:hypothetical protein|nr:hypothetical protein [Sphingomonadales bacterium]
MDADGACAARRRLRPAERAARREQGLRLGDGDGDGLAAAGGEGGRRAAGDAEPRAFDGRARLPAAARRRRDRGRADFAGRPPASPRSAGRAVGAVRPPARGRRQPLRLCRPARRPCLRPARLYAPAFGDGRSGRADQPPLARFDPCQLRRCHRRSGGGRREVRGVAVQRAGAGPASLGRGPGRSIPPLSGSAGTRLPSCRCRRAGRGRRARSSSSRAST